MSRVQSLGSFGSELNEEGMVPAPYSPKNVASSLLGRRENNVGCGKTAK